MIILPVLEWFMTSQTYVLQIFLLVFVFGLLMKLIRGRSS